MQFDDEKISSLAAALEKVEAPGDFNAGVRGRIASAPKSVARPGFGWNFRYVAPVTALIVIGLLIWNLPDRSGGLTAVAVDRRQGDVAVILPAERSVADDNSIAAVKGKSEPSPRNREDVRKKGDGTSESDRGGTIVSAVREGSTVTPRTSNDPSSAPGFERTRKIRIADVLFELGIESESIDGKLAVRTVRANSVAERSGIVAGDVIDAVNDRSVSADTTFVRSVEGRTLTIVRGGKKIVTTLK